MGLESEKRGERKMMRLRENESDIKERRDRVRSHCQWWWCRDLWLHLSNQNAEREREREREREGVLILVLGIQNVFY